MNNNETPAVRQPITAPESESLSRDLRRAISIVNAEYQQIDWEDQTFLNRVLTAALLSFEVKGGIYADN